MTERESRAHVVVTTTTDAKEAAYELSDTAVRERLAASAQVYGVSSVYRWAGEVTRNDEWRVDFKTRADLVPELSRYLRENHEFLEPEIVAVPIVDGSAGYLNWITEQTEQPPR
ncbi:divalent-cation tolerance protein CutA [Streptomyces sp. LP05-1]|uniref:Divalent-cation tolerance protein CutA n=1 Tax=Streptomyces pyxinae TaxID=2970734 RepID=A0ABT2CPF6_9ACTN|nr:divalent-cation tolerance protein CutA [Streptomyces sp. LP05-1]MCS0638957.1 divalent-cation tolerance protein CutA [Streptomyces sp. LP05-1]